MLQKLVMKSLLQRYLSMSSLDPTKGKTHNGIKVNITTPLPSPGHTSPGDQEQESLSTLKTQQGIGGNCNKHNAINHHYEKKLDRT